MISRKASIIILSITALWAPASVSAATAWHHTLKAGLEEARKTNRPVLVDVYADWCGYCRKLKESVYPAEAVQAQGKGYIFVTVNGEHKPEIMRRYNIQGFPTILFLDKNGYMLGKLNGMVSAERLVGKMRSVLARVDIEEKLITAAEKEPDAVGANYRLGLYYYEAGSFHLARRYFDRAWKAPKKDAPNRRKDALYNAGVASMELRDYAAAAGYWDEFVKAYPAQDSDFVYARFYRGICLKNLGQTGRARDDLRYASKHLPYERDRVLAKRELDAL